MISRIFAIGALATGLIGSTAKAQTISAPASTNQVTAHGVHTAGNAVGLAPGAHEILAPVVAGTVPATRPFTQGVTQAGRDLSAGTTQTGTNIQSGGLTVAPTGALTPARQQLEVNTSKALVTQAGSVATQAAKVPK